MAPPAVVSHIILLLRPGLISVQHRGIELLSGIAQTVDQVRMIRCVHVAAAAVAYIKPVQLAAAKYGDFCLPVQGQRAVVFQQNTAFRACLPNEFSDPRRDVALSIGGRLLLHETVAHGHVDDTLHQFSQLFLQLFHISTSSGR